MLAYKYGYVYLYLYRYNQHPILYSAVGFCVLVAVYKLHGACHWVL